MCYEVTEQVVGIVGSCLGGFLLMARDGGKGNEGCHVDCTAIVQDAAEFILDRLLLIISGFGGRVFWVWLLCCFSVFAGGGMGLV